MPTIAIAAQKGGVGKTTTAVHLAHRYALDGHHVLLVDMDQQASASRHLGIHPPNDTDALRPEVYDLLLNYNPKDRRRPYVPVRDTIIPAVRANLDLIPNSEAMAAAERELAQWPDKLRDPRRILSERLAEIKREYDIILIDTGPALNLCNVNAYHAADYVLGVAQPGKPSLEGIDALRDNLLSMSGSDLGHGGHLLGVLATMVDPVTNLAANLTGNLAKVYGDRYIGKVRRSPRPAEAYEAGRTLFEWPNTRGISTEYHHAADWVWRHMLSLEGPRYHPGMSTPALDLQRRKETLRERAKHS